MTEQTLQPLVDKIKELRVSIDYHIQRADFYKHNSERLRFAKSWLGKLLGELNVPNPYLTGQGMTDLAEHVDVHPEFNRESMLMQINLIDKTIQEIMDFAPTFESELDNYNSPIWNQITTLQKIGDKTKEDQVELAKTMIILTYPYFQLACQYLQEAKFQYNYLINDL